MTTIPILCYTMLYYTILHMYDDQNTKHSTVATIEYYINIAQDDIYTMMQYTIQKVWISCCCSCQCGCYSTGEGCCGVGLLYYTIL